MRNRLPLADYYGKAKNSTGMCNRRYMPIKKIKKERKNKYEGSDEDTQTQC